QEARKLGKPVIVDPKGKDFSIYQGTTMITPNRVELATRMKTMTTIEIETAAREVIRAVGSQAVLVTRSEDGMRLVPARGEPTQVASYPVTVREVSGAADAVVGVLGAMLPIGADFEHAMRAGNAAAAVVIGKRGTASVSAVELRARILPPASLAAKEKVIFDW